MKRGKLRNIAGTIMWFFAGMFLWGHALTLMERREEEQAREGHFPLEADDIRRYSAAIYLGIVCSIIVIIVCICWVIGAIHQ